MARGERAREDRVALVNRLSDVVTSGRRAPSFDFETALGVVEAAVTEVRSVATRARLCAALDLVKAGRKVSWREFLNLLDEAQITLAPWDLVTFGAYAIEVDVAGGQKIIGTPTFSDWAG